VRPRPLASLAILVVSAPGCACLPRHPATVSTPSATAMSIAYVGERDADRIRLPRAIYDSTAYRTASDVTALPLGWQLDWQRPQKSYDTYDPETVFYRHARLCERRAGLLATLRDAAAPPHAIARVRARPRGDAGIGHACNEVWRATFHLFLDRDGKEEIAVYPRADPPLADLRGSEEGAQAYTPMTRFPPECWSAQGCEHEAWEALTAASPEIRSTASAAHPR
jgi:hypothetical protein